MTLSSPNTGLDVDGLYRVSGNLAVIQKLRFAVNHGMDCVCIYVVTVQMLLVCVYVHCVSFICPSKTLAKSIIYMIAVTQM